MFVRLFVRLRRLVAMGLPAQLTPGFALRLAFEERPIDVVHGFFLPIVSVAGVRPPARRIACPLAAPFVPIASGVRPRCPCGTTSAADRSRLRGHGRCLRAVTQSLGGASCSVERTCVGNHPQWSPCRYFVTVRRAMSVPLSASSCCSRASEGRVGRRSSSSLRAARAATPLPNSRASSTTSARGQPQPLVADCPADGGRVQAELVGHGSPGQ